MTERDRVIERALADVRTPPHGDGFWSALEASLDEVDGAERPRPAKKRPPLRWLAIAATLVGVVAVAAVLARIDADPGQVVQADHTRVPTTATTGLTTTVAATAGAPEQAVRGWLQALGDGDYARAVELIGPKSRAYIESLGGNVEGMVREEGYGGWPDSPDWSTTEVELGRVAGSEITIVVVSGTWTGEGDTGLRHDAIPAVRSGDGWLVEPWALNPDSAGRLEITSPAPSESGRGLATVAGNGVIAASAAGNGEFFFSLNDGEVVREAGVRRGGGASASWDPPGELPKQTHLIVIAYVDGGVVTAFAGTFAVR